MASCSLSAIQSPSVQTYIVAVDFTNAMEPSVLSLQSSGSRALTVVKLWPTSSVMSTSSPQPAR